MRPVRYGLKSRLSVTLFSIGVLLFVVGTIGIAVDFVPGLPVSGPNLQLDIDLELVGLVMGGCAVVGDRIQYSPRPVTHLPATNEECRPVYITRPLLTTLLQFAQECEPESLSIGIAVTPAERLTGADDLPDSVPVFTHFYVPDRLNSVSSVFGIDLQTPPRQIHSLFVTHPRSQLTLTKHDDLHAVVLVAVPPWGDESIAAFDRRGHRYSLHMIDAVPPAESLPSANQ